MRTTKTLIIAFEELYKVNKLHHRLLIIGDGPSRNDLEILVNEKDLTSKVLFLGKKTNPFVWMKNADIFILSSKTEGFGLVLVEAMCCDTFVISSDCRTGPREILQNGECGDLFEVGNIRELQEKLMYAINNKEYMQLKIKKAKLRIKEFDRKISSNQLVTLV
jgi:glycosyltransferase involved in cell wall biosynthesis